MWRSSLVLTLYAQLAMVVAGTTTTRRRRSPTCPSSKQSRKFVCENSATFDSCSVGGCPLDDRRPAEYRQNGYMVRAEPCGDFFKYDPAWGGSHITMSTIQHYTNPHLKFFKVKEVLAGSSTPHRSWRPNNFRFEKNPCGPLGPNFTTQFEWKPLYVASKTLSELGGLLNLIGFDAPTSNFHVTLGYPGAASIPSMNYTHNPEYKTITEKLRSAQWQLTLLYMNNKTNRIDILDSVLLGLPDYMSTGAVGPRGNDLNRTFVVAGGAGGAGQGADSNMAVTNVSESREADWLALPTVLI